MVTMTETIPRFRTLTLVILVMLGLGTVWAVPASGQDRSTSRLQPVFGSGPFTWSRGST